VNKAIILAIACSAAIAGVSHAQTAADSAAIKECALNYIEGWYEGSAERMERALHPELAKRIVGPSRETGESALRNMTADQLIEATAAGYGTRTPAAERRTDVTILDIYEGTAAVRIDAGEWIDYLHVAQWNGGWKIINVLWQVRPEARGR
jgi:hypothetical protein